MTFSSSSMPSNKFTWIVLLATQLALGGAGLHRAAADELKLWEKRQKYFEAESIALFQVILEEREKDGKKRPSPCEIRAEWLDYSVPQGIAEKYFGLKIYADLSPSYTPGEPPEILDPKGIKREVFCTKKQDDEKWNALLEDLKKGEVKDEKEPGRSLRSLENHRLEYSIPIFDRHYRRAVVIGSTENSRWWVQPDGRLRSSFDSGIWASIYVKRKGRWQLLKDEPLAAGHGGT
jgi:hypothetical protein